MGAARLRDVPMSFVLVDESTVTAPRELHRPDAIGRDGSMAFPDVGGDPVVTMFRTWRCRHCRAMSTGAGLCPPPQKCGKCGLR